MRESAPEVVAPHKKIRSVCLTDESSSATGVFGRVCRTGMIKQIDVDTHEPMQSMGRDKCLLVHCTAFVSTTTDAIRDEQVAGEAGIKERGLSALSKEHADPCDGVIRNSTSNDAASGVARRLLTAATKPDAVGNYPHT